MFVGYVLFTMILWHDKIKSLKKGWFKMEGLHTESSTRKGMERVNKKGRKSRINKLNFRDNVSLSVMLIPAAVFYILFSYLPMFGVVIAFKDYRYSDGIFGSRWVGLDNFKYFFTSNDFWVLVRNTIGYSVIFIVVGVVTGVIVALVLYEVKYRFLTKYFQTVFILPNFMSWVVVAYIIYAFLDPVYGFVNNFFQLDIAWYSKAKYWPIIIVIANTWKHIGMNSVMYYATLMGIDTSLFEAAKIDGANKLQQIRYITLPELKSVVAILVIMGVGNIFRGDFGLFYQVPMDVGMLYSATDVIDTYIYRGLRTGDLSINAAVGLIQSVVGLVTVLASNFIVKKIDSSSAMF